VLALYLWQCKYLVFDAYGSFGGALGCQSAQSNQRLGGIEKSGLSYWLFKYLVSSLFAALTAQSGGKAPRFDRADPRVGASATPYTPADLL